jgi:hypothetical protein
MSSGNPQYVVIRYILGTFGPGLCLRGAFKGHSPQGAFLTGLHSGLARPPASACELAKSAEYRPGQHPA